MNWPFSNDPEPPQNVKVELRDGTLIPCEMVYDGWRNGSHVWVAVAPILVEPKQVVSIHADMLPAHTSIIIGIGEEGLEHGN